MELLYNSKLHPKFLCINLIEDSAGNCFKIPNYCINEPYHEKKLVSDTKIKNLQVEVLFLSRSNLYKYTKAGRDAFF